VRLIGDGAAQFTVQELGTLARERLTPVVVVADNDVYTVTGDPRADAFYNDIVGWQASAAECSPSRHRSSTQIWKSSTEVDDVRRLSDAGRRSRRQTRMTCRRMYEHATGSAPSVTPTRRRG